MPCDTRLKAGETIQQRAATVRRRTLELSEAIVAGRVRVKVGPQGAVAFEGWTERDGITDACAYRRLMSAGSALARAKIAQAEQLAGRSINRQVVGQGVHSHDGGLSWHDHKG